MFLHILLVLPIIESANIVINEYTVKQVKLDDDMINKVLINIFPKDKVIEMKTGNETPFNSGEENLEQDDLAGSFMIPHFENEGQKRFRKVSNRVKPGKFNIDRDKIEPDKVMKATGDLDPDPLMLLSDLVVKLLDFLPAQLKLRRVNSEN